MDDDGYPDDAALEHLIGQMKSGVACASSVVLREYDRRNFVFPFPKLDREGFPAIFGWPRKVSALDQLRARSPDGVYPYAHFFNGCLIATGAIRKIGNVETRFFIFGDEVDYFMRLRSVGNVFSVLKAHHFHPDVSQRPLNELKFYYFVKNTFILNKRYMNWHSFRNVCTVGIAIARVAKRNGIITAASYVAGSRVHILAKSIARGIKGNLGNDF
jgi:GT2 family glycosyltransferase